MEPESKQDSNWIKGLEDRLRHLVDDLSLRDLNRTANHWIDRLGRERASGILDIIADEKLKRYHAGID